MRNHRRSAGVLIAVITFGYSVAASAQTSYQIISVTVDPSVVAPLQKIDTVVQAGSDSRNRFVWHLVHQLRGKARGAVLLIPSTYANFEQYMLNENSDPMQSLAAKLASADYEVHGFSPRTSMLAPEACSSGSVDCSIMATWGFRAYLDDIDFIRGQIDRKLGKPVVGGLSLGGALGFGAVNDNPDGYAGLYLHDSMIRASNYPDALATTTSNCSQLTLSVETGSVYDEDTPALIKTTISSGEAATATVFGAPLPTFGTPTFTVFATDLTHTRLEYSYFPRVLANALDLNDVESNALSRDEQCSYSGDATFSGNLAAFTGPILAIEQGLAFGPYMQQSIDLTSSRGVTVVSNPSFGHFDSHTNRDQLRYVQGPLLDWLDNVVFP